MVPHQLSDDILKLFRDGLENLGREVFEINDRTTVMKESATILINKKGILCELYADFPIPMWVEDLKEAFTQFSNLLLQVRR